MSMEKIQELRKKIDGIDDKLLDLLNERARIVIEVGNIKKTGKIEFHSPSREREIIERLTGRNNGPLPQDTLKAVFREIMSSSLSLERPLKIAYLGPRATFTHMAGMQQFGLAAQYVPAENIKDVFSEVERGRADYGVVPIENTTSGAVNYTLDMFIDSDLKIAAEIMLEVSQHLMNKSGNIKDIKKIYTISPAAAQCRQWLEKNLPGVPVLDASSTAAAAEMAGGQLPARARAPHKGDAVSRPPDAGKTERDR